MTSQITDSDTRHPGNGGGIEARRELWTKAGPVVSALPPQEVLALQERAEATVGEPGAMGLFGFAVGTLLIAIPITGWLPQQAISAALPAVLVFAGIAQFIAGLVAFRKGTTFAGTAFCCADRILLGVELFCFAYISLVLAAAAAKVNIEFVLILLALVPGFGLAAVPQVGAAAGFGHVGGWFLIASAAFAFYGATALVLNSAYQRTVLPLPSRA